MTGSFYLKRWAILALLAGCTVMQKSVKQEWSLDADERKECGMKGHEFVMSDDSMMSSTAMCQNFIDHMDTAFEKWTPRKRYTLYKA